MTDDDTPDDLLDSEDGIDFSESEPARESEEPKRPTKEESTLGRLGAKLITTIPKPMLGVRETMFKRMAIKSIENYHKAAGGDAIGINAKAGQRVELEPVLYRTPQEIDEGEKPGWKVKGRDKVWNAASEGNSVNYLGRAPTVMLEDDDHVEAGWLAPRIGEAIELDNYWPLFTDPEINAVVDVNNTAGGRAVADGGMNIDLELESPGQWAQDNIVDLDSGPGYDGMRISTKKAREWRAENTDSEHMQMQEDRGYLRGLANGDEGPGIIKLLLICAGIILGTLGIVLLGPRLISGGGGGGGALPSLMVNSLGAFGAI
jgi:hypothetical protein